MGDKKPIPVIDLFAGPGGLGEGFSALTDKQGNRVFRIALSIEKDEYAHQTLELRNFFRQFEKQDLPEEYYSHIRGKMKRGELYNKFPIQANKAKEEAWRAELGLNSVDEIDERINKALNNKSRWMLIGGPPCQAYSVIGRVRQKWANGLDENDPRVFLYREYYRILAVHSPPVFIMENVKGLLSSKLKDKFIFQEILNDLEDPVKAYKKLKGKKKTLSDCPGYYLFSLVKNVSDYTLEGKPGFEPEDFIIKAEDYGIPQKRHRLIILGIRKDIFKLEPDILIEREWIKIDEVINGLPRLRSGLSKQKDSREMWKNVLADFMAEGNFKITDKQVSREIKKVIDDLRFPQKDRGNEFIPYKSDIEYGEEREWFIDSKIQGVCNHSTRAHLVEDLYRYLFASCFAKVKNKSPKLNDFPVNLVPRHRNVRRGIFEDRFRVQIYGEPARTITSHIAKDGHYYIHPDPTQCRSLTVREAARIQAFPDNYFFCGPRTSQYVQVGNAVPPLLAYKIAAIVEDIFEKAGYI